MKKNLKGMSILIVDDDPDLRELLSWDFSSAECEVESAESGVSAIELIRKKKFDLIFSDMRMPQGDGRFLAKEVLKLKKNEKPLLFLYSGFNDISSQEAKDLGITHIFSKPSKISDIIDDILKYI